MDILVEDSTVRVEGGDKAVVVEKNSIEALVIEGGSTVVVDQGSIAAVFVEQPEIVMIEQDVTEAHVLATGGQGPAGVPGAPGSLGAETYTVAEFDIGGHRVLVTDSVGAVIYADNTVAGHADQAARISTQAASANTTVTVQVAGRITEPSWAWTPGAALYVGANGLMTETPPASPAVFSKIIAVAETATRILMLNEAPVVLA